MYIFQSKRKRAIKMGSLFYRPGAYTKIANARDINASP
jgi:hypothetical protein